MPFCKRYLPEVRQALRPDQVGGERLVLVGRVVAREYPEAGAEIGEPHLLLFVLREVGTEQHLPGPGTGVRK